MHAVTAVQLIRQLNMVANSTRTHNKHYYKVAIAVELLNRDMFDGTMQKSFHVCLTEWNVL